MSESVFARIWNAIKPPPAVETPGAGPRQKLQPKQKRLLAIACTVVVLAGGGWAVYSYIGSAPDRAEAEYQAGLALMQPGKYQLAMARFTHAIDIHAVAKYYLERGVAHRLLNQPDLAIADFEQAIDLDPNAARAYSGLGTIYRDRGDRGRALENYGKSIAIAPNVDALFERGEMYEAGGEHQKAIDDFSRAIEGMRDAPYIYRARAMARRNLGDQAGYEQDRDLASSIEHPR
jgi:tetratricopeptide (TPR) repeat protein